MSDLPAPPYPADTRAKGWRFGLDTHAICNSDAWALQRDGFVHGVYLMMFLEAWTQEPCGTLPIDETDIAKMVRVRSSFIAKHRAGLLRDWQVHSDGRRYHPLVTVQVHEMLYNRARGYRKHHAEVLARDGAFCSYCGRGDVPLSLDHVVARSRGGQDDPSNLVPACKPCNSSKGARSLDEWRSR